MSFTPIPELQIMIGTEGGLGLRTKLASEIERGVGFRFMFLYVNRIMYVNRIKIRMFYIKLGKSSVRIS